MAVITALGIVVLVGFVGFAVDVGLAFNERRQEQSAVDAAVLSAAHAALRDGQTPEQVFEEVVRMSHTNMRDAVPIDEWREMFRNCQDPTGAGQGYLPFVVNGDPVPCLSFGPEFDRIRVKLPETELPTAFAGVVGHDSWTITAAAEAGLVPGNASPNVLPFALPSAPDNGFRDCLRQPPAGLSIPPEECTGMSTNGSPGNSGVIHLTRPTDINAGGGNACNGNAALTVEYNAAMGADHMLSVYVPPGLGGTAPPVNELDSCRDGLIPPAEPNQFTPDTGTANMAALFNGLVRGATFPDGEPARLQRGPFPKDVVINGDNIDSHGLWNFIDDRHFNPDNGRLPTSCNPDFILTLAPEDPRVGLDNCFVDYWVMVENAKAAGTQMPPPLFTTEVLESPRFGWVPEIWQSNMQGNQPRTIKRFRPLFIQTLYFQQGNNRYAFDPGVHNCRYRRYQGGTFQGCTTGNVQHFRQASAYFLATEAMLPLEVYTQGITAGGGNENAIALVR
ncbi:MAG: Tad domain-containing protein [Acidimicrobiia bacterium]|nr:Tad domain-containing protein [Acidimicrobiia bacterium]